MKEIVLHLGYPKSGSSVIQVALRTFSDRLAAAGIAYPLLDPREVEIIRTRGFGSGNGVFLVEAIKMKRPLQPLLEKIDAAPQDMVVISTETFGNLTRAQIAPMVDWFAEQNHKLKLIAYVRDPFDLVLSGYSQSTKFGQMHSSLEIACSRFNDPQQRVRNTFSGFEIEERSFKGARADLLNDFLQWVRPGAPRIEEKTCATNRSLSLEEIMVIRRLVAAGLPRREVQALAEKLLQTEQVGNSLRHDEATVRALCTRLGLDPQEHLWRVGPRPEGSGAAIQKTALKVIELLVDRILQEPTRKKKR